MMKIRKQLLTALCLATIAGSTNALAGGEQTIQAVQDLMQQHPGVRMWHDGDRSRIVYGQKMTMADSPASRPRRSSPSTATFSVSAASTWSRTGRAT